MAQKSTTSGSKEINQILASLNQQGEFAISVLTDEQGLPIASATRNGLDADRQSAMVAVVQRATQQIGRRLSMAEPDELALFTVDGQRLIVRFFNTTHHNLILAVTVPSKGQRYRRLTNQAIADIRRVWSQYWE